MQMILCLTAGGGLLYTVISMFVINKEKPSPVLRYINIAGALAGLSLCAFFLELNTPSGDAKLLCIKLEMIALAEFIVVISFLSLSFSQIKLPDYVKRGLLIYTVLVFLLIVLSALGFGYLDIFDMILIDNYRGVLTMRGPAYYTELSFSVIIGVLCFYITIIHSHSDKVSHSKENVHIAYLILIPVIGRIVDAIYPLKGYSVIPLFMLLTWIATTSAIFKYRIFDTMQMAKDDILDTVNDGFVVVDTLDRVMYVNEKAKQMYPSLKYEVTQENVIKELLKKEKNDVVIGKYHYHIEVVKFFNKKTYKGQTIWNNDRTEEYNATKRLIELKEEAENANRAKSVFLANMSHEIRTPLNAIMGMTEMILHDNINAKVEENARNIKSASNTLLSIINSILDFSKIENGKEEIVTNNYNLGVLIHDIQNMINLKLIDKNVELIVHVKENIPSVLIGDETHVRQIFTNILTNAVKYTKRGYIRMNVDCEPMPTDPGNVLIKVSIEDTGCGIKPESINTLFDSFQRADMIKNRTIEGTGLGLAICKRLVESMGGEIGVKSTYGIGSVFSFHIIQGVADESPLGDYDTLELPSDMEPEMTLLAPLAKVLVVDDNITNIKVAQGILSMYQVRVDTALSGSECIEKVHKNNYHMIFLDQMMPEMDGIETAKLIRLDNDPKIRNLTIIALTANAISGTREMFLSHGFQEYISKPINIASVEAVLKRFLPEDVIHYVEKKNDDTDYSEADIHMRGVDAADGLANYGNDKAKYLQILKFIYDDGPMHLQRIKDYLEGEHYREYVYEVHSLKGLMSGIGAKQLAEFSRIQEYAGRDGNIDIIKKESSYVVEQYAEILDEIKRVLTDTGYIRDDIQEIREEELTWKEFCDMLHSLQGSIELLEQGEAARKTDNLLTYPLDAGIRKQLIDIKHEINEFEYDKASELIRQLLV